MGEHGRLVATLLRAAGDLQKPQADPGAVRTKAGEIMSDSRFQQHQNPITRALRWVLERLSSLLGTSAAGGNRVVGLALLAVALVALVLVVRTLGQRTARRAKADEHDDATITMVTERDAAAWRAEAERLEAAGEWRLALRARYRVLVRELVDRRVLRDPPASTTGELLREVQASRPDVALAFAEATSVFERVWYGGELADASVVATLRTIGDRVVGAVPA